MSEQPAELQRINWASCFSFTHLFRAFKMAIHPGKLALALAAILLTGLWGVLLDSLWSTAQQPMPDEVHAFWQTPDIDQWRADALAGRAAAAQGAYQISGRPMPQTIVDKFKNDPRGALKDARRSVKQQYYDAIATAKSEDVPAIAARYNTAYIAMDRLRTRGVFRSFLEFETNTIRRFVEASATLNLVGGMADVMHARQTRGPAPRLVAGPAEPGVARVSESDIGALPSLLVMARGVQWFVMEHPVFALMFLLGKIAIWSLFGGAICRMAAMNFARDERIPLKTALDFARRKVVGFATAPLLPVGLVAGIGFLLFLGGLLGSIPYVGEIIAGLGMILALAGGFVIALVMIGGVAGGSLMWPTIAAEGSDGFDAMSRSFSYVYSRPWRTALYAAIAAVYGGICYVFARFFVLLLLWITRFFVGLGMAGTTRLGTGSAGGTRIDSLWPRPTYDELIRSAPPLAAQYWDPAGRVLIYVWVALIVLLLCSFLVTFYFSASTIMYFLLRREVDATDLEDVYAEDEPEEDVTGTASVTPVSTSAAPASVNPAETGRGEDGPAPAGV